MKSFEEAVQAMFTLAGDHETRRWSFAYELCLEPALRPGMFFLALYQKRDPAAAYGTLVGEKLPIYGDELGPWFAAAGAHGTALALIATGSAEPDDIST